MIFKDAGGNRIAWVVDFWKEIYEKWQRRWEEARLFEADPDGREKVFVNGAYPYINGRGHLGHLYSTYLPPDVYARYKRMKGYNVLYPQGFHATGQPIAALARRLREGDEIARKILLKSGVPEEEIEKFKDKRYWLEYFSRVWREDLKSLGMSIDWRRTFYTTEYNKPYDLFIRWQYRRLKEKGVIEKGKHPVVWCPKEELPITDHDRSEGEGVVPEEAVIIKFRDERGRVFPALTFRPETVYGVTNVWIHPDDEYVEVEVEGEIWVIAFNAYERLKFQIGGDVIRTLSPEELYGLMVENPVTGDYVPVVPADFVDTSFGTGVVMSVPAHAPYDWVAVKEARERGYDIPEAITVISVPGYSPFPARDVVEEMGIENQKDERLEEATKKVYKKEFYEGVMAVGPWKGRKVSEIKEELVEYLRERRVATTVYVLPERVVCRCGAEGVVNIVEQWFLRYSDERWKEKAREAANNTIFTPEEARNAVMRTIGWLKEWPFTRDIRASLGTKLPWDETQYIESLSDSTIYMAYYTIAKWLQNAEDYGIDLGKIDDSFFDYVFLGKGEREEVSKRTGIPEELLEEMRREFLYWYPTDVRFVAKDLLQNHVTMSIFHHALLLPGKHPRRWVAAGHVTVSGKKMSKSKANFVTMREVVEKYGADPVRFAVALARSNTMDDSNIETSVMEEMVGELDKWLGMVTRIYNSGGVEEGLPERWIRSVVGSIVEKVERAYEEINLREALIEGWYRMRDVWKTYTEMRNVPHRETARYFVESWIRILHPIIPHYTEEAWERIGGKGFVIESGWPEARRDEKVEKLVEYVFNLVEDINTVKELAGGGKRVRIYLAPPEWYPVLRKVKGMLEKGERSRVWDAIPERLKRELSPTVQKALKNPGKLPDVIGDREEEEYVIRELKPFIERKTGMEVLIEEGTPENKQPLPFKPAIIVE